jgi:hypothetical protein
MTSVMIASFLFPSLNWALQYPFVPVSLFRLGSVRQRACGRKVNRQGAKAPSQDLGFYPQITQISADYEFCSLRGFPPPQAVRFGYLRIKKHPFVAPRYSSE